jgi:pyridoxal phosphate enzyme (YggS family)
VTETLEQRLRTVRDRIRAACARSSRDPSTVRLLAVSKTKPASYIAAAHALGQYDFGENYVQELVRKRAELASLSTARLHLIGHLQSNKAGKAVQAAACIHTLDAIKLVHEVDRQARARSKTIEAFIEVNVAGESQKSGVTPVDLGAVIEAARAASGIQLLGLMAIPPWSDDPERARPHFRALAELARGYQLTRLSMGMSHDFEVAIEEGATDVRVGTALFGERGSR